MKTKIPIVFGFCLLFLTNCNQQQPNNKAFTLKGNIDGPNTEYLILSYLDSSNVYVSDTLPIKNKSFAKEGYLINTQSASLSSNLSSRDVEDPNRLSFFLEPNDIKINLKEGQFADATINGSKTQVESVDFEKTTNLLYDKIELIRVERQKLFDKKKETGTERLDTEIKNLTTKWGKILDEIKNVRFQYALDNPQSYLSADLINLYRKVLPKDSLKMFYSHMDPIIKESSYGIKIKEQINFRIVNSGDVAPNFSGPDADGTILSLNQFKGKTVLLDFGAAWCVPCVKNHPEVKRIYDKYHPKGLEIIGISCDEDELSWKENIVKEKLNWHHIYEGYDKHGTEGSISKLYFVQPIPAYILIDEEGLIVDRYSAADKDHKSLKDLEEKLNILLASNKS